MSTLIDPAVNTAYTTKDEIKAIRSILKHYNPSKVKTARDSYRLTLQDKPEHLDKEECASISYTIRQMLLHTVSAINYNPRNGELVITLA